MTTDSFQRKLTAILSADVVGYSRLMGDDEAATVKTLETYKGVMFSLIKQHRGRVVDSPGDNLLAEFGSVVDAVQCAVSIQKEFQTRNAELPGNRRMEFRIGINLGDVIEEEDRIYGDGVNVAARLEALCDPGGICVSKTAFDQIESKLPLGYEFLGEQTVKNIPKPIGAYRVLMEPRVTTAKGVDEKKAVYFWRRKKVLSLGIVVILAIAAVLYWNFYPRGPSIEPASVERMAYPLPDKPSIAVLPFKNETGDPGQDYIGDGLSWSICDALSVSSQMFVIDRNATFIYKEKPVKPQQVANDLGVQYILNGSIQKSGDQLRVTAQLTDALAGHYLWSDKYDREMRNLFRLQDEITKRIIVSLQVRLTSLGEDTRVFAKSTDNLEAWKHFIKGKELFENFIDQDNAKAQEHLESALDLDPKYVSAMSWLGFTHLFDFLLGWSDSPSASMNRASELAQKAIKLDDQDPFAHGLLGYISLQKGQYEKAITEGERAITLSPNFALGYGLLGYIMSYCGQFDEAITMVNKGFRLNPNLHSSFLIILTRTYILLKRYEKAFELCNEMEEHTLNGRLGEFKYAPPLYSSWIYQELGREEEARAYMAEALKRKPDLSLEWYERLSAYKDPAHLERVLDAYRRAGMPEKPPGAVQEKPSIAVLPFDDYSPKKDQEYFVLGLSEEILNSLTQIPDLTVTAKTSSFYFKNKDKTFQEIANALDVEYILEGSVRKAGDNIRITAQLIKAGDGSHLWSKQYDKEYKVEDMFAIQGDIASSVADELKLSLEVGSLKELGGTDNEKAYGLYLEAKAQNNNWRREIALQSIEGAIELDPEFALAWVFKSVVHLALASFSSSDRTQIEFDLAFKAAQQAIEIDPSLGMAYLQLGTLYAFSGEFFKGESSYKKGMELTKDLNDYLESGLFGYYVWLGYGNKAIEYLGKLLKTDPLNEGVYASHLTILGSLGNIEESEKMYERGKTLFGSNWIGGNALITQLRIGSREAISLDELPQVGMGLSWDIIKSNLKSHKEGLEALHSLYNDIEDLSPMELYCIATGASYFGDHDFAVDALEKASSISYSGLWHLWMPMMQGTRKAPRFKEFVREIGLVDYWKEYGWPDLCRPIGDDDFECD